MDITLKIHNEEDIQYLQKTEPTKLDRTIQMAISIGLKSIQMSEVNMDCHSYIDPIKEIMMNTTNYNIDKLSTIEEKLNDILHIKSNSSRKGKLAEDICRDILVKQYPSWEFIDVSQEGYEADCRAYKTPVGQILYEFKNYDYNVNKDQITKFHRDLEHTNIKYGIFVSNTSGIVGKKNIEWEIVNNKLIIYVSNMGFSGYGCIIGTELLLSLIEIDILNKDKNCFMYKNHELSELMETISELIDKLKNNIEFYTKHKQLISDQRIKINQSIDILEKNAFDCLLNLNDTYNKIVQNTQKIQCEQKIINTFDLDTFLDKLNNEKFNLLIKKFVSLFNNHTLYSSDKNIIINDTDNNILCYTNITKSKIYLNIPIKKDEILININYEKIKNSEIIIELKDSIENWNIIHQRLNLNL